MARGGQTITERQFGCLVWICCFSKGGDVMAIHQSHAYQAHWTHHHVNTHDPWCWIPEQVGRYHGGPCHLKGALVFSQLWGNASDYPWQIIPMQGSSDHCKPWWGCWGLATRFCPLWHHLPGSEWLVGLSSGWWLWYVAVAIPHHRPPKRTLLCELSGFYCGYALVGWVPPTFMT